ncbi:TetR family transcriptional regulator [Kutzneria sp. NPDC051319]|uniref:TetR family transcriptional regulator n=1 Tax=Kutzneria sp. NPDC051319 TaxID=3155047 RepID=UPI00343760F9
MQVLDAVEPRLGDAVESGAQVDRIAAAASANKQAIYACFGSKEGRFEAVPADRLRILRPPRSPGTTTSNCPPRPTS